MKTTVQMTASHDGRMFAPACPPPLIDIPAAGIDVCPALIVIRPMTGRYGRRTEGGMVVLHAVEGPTPSMRISRRLMVYYVGLGAIVAGVLALGFSLGSARHSEPNVAGVWTTAPDPDPCLGPTFVVQQSGAFAQIVPLAVTGPHAKLRVRGDRLSGIVQCSDGSRVALNALVSVNPRRLRLQLAGRPSVLAADTGKPVPQAGTQTLPPTSLAGTYQTVPASPCLGANVTLGQRRGVGRYRVADAAGTTVGTLAFNAATGAVNGRVQCQAGPTVVRLVGGALDRTVTLAIPGPRNSLVSQFELQRTRDSENLYAAFFLAVAVIMLVAQLGGMLMPLIGQPRVMGEVLAGILLGPTLLGAVAPRWESALFPSDIIPYITVAANLGLIFYVFLIGLELDFSALRERLSQTLAISSAGVAVPMALGVLASVPLYPLLGSPKAFVPFALFMGVSLSITAFPVLARILAERRMLARPLGVLAMTCAAIDDVAAWVLIALATATVGGAASNGVAETIGLTAAFALVMVFGVRPLLARAALAVGETGRPPTGWVVVVFAGVLLSAYVTAEIGVAIIFGAFVMGAIMPRHAGLTEEVTRVESFVVAVLLPLFFASTGLRTNMLLIDRPELLLITIGLSALAIVAKFGGTLVAARVTGLGWRDSAVLGSLMNTRGLTELIVLNLALDLGVLTDALFAALVVMALVTTFMTGPVLALLGCANELTEDAHPA